MTGFGRLLIALYVLRPYAQYEVVWRWWNPLTWVVAPIVITITALMIAADAIWRERDSFALRVKPWYRENGYK